jgi:hypothetical protein
MPTFPASRLANIAPFHVMELMARARALEAEGRDIIHMEVGEPDFPTPEPIIAAARAVIESGHVFYTPALGFPELRRAIADFYQTRYGINIPAVTHSGHRGRFRCPAADPRLPGRSGQRMAAQRSRLSVQPSLRPQLRRRAGRHAGRPGEQLSTHPGRSRGALERTLSRCAARFAGQPHRHPAGR